MNKPERKSKKNRLTVSLDGGDYAALEALARQSDVSMSWIIRQAIHRFVNVHTVQHELPLDIANASGGMRRGDL